MDAVIADIVIFGLGACAGSVLSVLVGFKLVSSAVEKIVDGLIQSGRFHYKGRRYTVAPTTNPERKT